MVEDKVNMQQDRRREPDLLIEILRWLGIFGWFVMIVALYILDLAKPEEENIFTKAVDFSVENVGSEADSLSFLCIDLRALHKHHWYYYQFQKTSS